MRKKEQKCNVLLFVNNYEYFLSKELYCNFKYEAELDTEIETYIGHAFLLLLSDYKLIIDTLNNCIEDLLNPNNKLDNIDNYLITLNKKLKDINFTFADIILNDIYNQYYNDKININDININMYIASLLESYIHYIEDSKNFIDSYYNIISSNEEKKKNKNRSLLINNFELSSYSLLAISIPHYEKILCLLDENNLIPSTSLAIINLSNYEDIGEKNITKNIQKYDITNKKYCYATSYYIEYLKDFISIFINFFLESNIYIKKCKNCGKYFIPTNKISETLCNNIFKRGKTCKELSYELELKNNKIKEIYRRNYKTANRKKHENENNIPNIEDKYNTWLEKANEQRILASNGKISSKDFEQWFKDNKNWHLKNNSS